MSNDLRDSIVITTSELINFELLKNDAWSD